MNNNSCEYGFYRSITAFFMSYLDIPADFFEQNGILKKSAIKVCAKYLIEKGVFDDANEMREDFLKSFEGILPMWIFEDLI